MCVLSTGWELCVIIIIIIAQSVTFRCFPDASFLEVPWAAMAAMADGADEAYTTELYATENTILDLKIEMRF